MKMLNYRGCHVIMVIGFYLFMQLSLDLLQDWLSSLGVNSLDLNEGAGYVDFRGLESFRTVNSPYTSFSDL